VADTTTDILSTTSLDMLHRELGAKMVPFAGYAMPVNYELGVLKEHLHTRSSAGLFDVSHMGQAILNSDSSAADALETLVPGSLSSLKPGQVRYTLLLNEEGGIVDDLMVSRPPSSGADGELFLIVNAARRAADYCYISERLAGKAHLSPLESLSLLALQGPMAAPILEAIVPEVSSMPFMTCLDVDLDKIAVRIFRSGYTGEDGFEISVSNGNVEPLARLLLGYDGVQPIGLGARDSLRIEAGLCLYGSDIDTDTSPVEADLSWVISSRRRRDGGFPGADRIQRELIQGPERKRVGLRPLGKAPARAHTSITDVEGEIVGEVTSGCFGPTVGGPVSMGYVIEPIAVPGTMVKLVVRGKQLDAEVVSLPFIPHRYFKGNL